MGLEGYVERVMTEGLDARAAASSVDVAAAEVEAAGLWPNPSVDVWREANSAGVRVGESQDQLLLSLPLAVSGRLGLMRDAAGKDLEAAQARLAFARGRLRHDATAAFLELAAARKRLAAEKAALRSLDPIVLAIVAREKAGESAGYDRIRIELEKTRIEDSLAAAAAAEAMAMARARALLPPDVAGAVFAELDLAVDLPPGPRPGGALARGDLRALGKEAEAARLEEAAAWRALVPEPKVVGGGYLLDVGHPEIGFGYGVGIEIPIPLFDHGQGGRARARARRSRAEAERAALLHAVETQLSAATADKRARVERARKHDTDVVGRADELVEIVDAAYRGGGAELLALVDAERSQREAHIASTDLHLAARLAENDVLLLSGAYDDAPPASTQP